MGLVVLLVLFLLWSKVTLFPTKKEEAPPPPKIELTEEQLRILIKSFREKS